VGGLWTLPLFKALEAELPDPVPGHDGEPVIYELRDDGDRLVASADLAGLLQVVQPLDLSTEQSLEEDFRLFRERRKRLRGLGSVVVHVVLATGGDAEALAELVERKTARKPSNVFLLDAGGETFARLRDEALTPFAEVVLLDRHGRLRGAYGPGEAEGDRFAQDLASLANWPASDPPVGEAIGR